MSAGADPIRSVFSTDVCPNCGYSLLGLPDSGTCPECGRTYDQSEIILYGYARGAHENVGNAKGSRIIWIAGVSVAFGFTQFAWFGFRQFGPVIGWLTMAAVCVIPVLYGLARRSASGHPGLVQVRLSKEGCIQYDDLAGRSPLVELYKSYAWVLPIAGAIVLVALWRRDSIRGFHFWFWMALALALECYEWIECRKFRRLMQRARDDSIADWNAVYRPLQPWNEVESFSIQLTADETCRLRIIARGKWMNHDVVDAEIKCSAEEIKSIRALLNHFIGIARSAAPSPL